MILILVDKFDSTFSLAPIKMFQLIGMKRRIRHMMDNSEFVSGLRVKINIETAKVVESKLRLELLE